MIQIQCFHYLAWSNQINYFDNKLGEVIKKQWLSQDLGKTFKNILKAGKDIEDIINIKSFLKFAVIFQLRFLNHNIKIYIKWLDNIIYWLFKLTWF